MTDEWNAGSYEDELAQGLALSGESSSYFAEGRVGHVVKRCDVINLAPRSILEFGCGTGNNLVFLAQAFPTARLIGLERSESLRSAAERRFEGKGMHFEDDRDYKDWGSADLIFVNGVFHHIEPADRPAALAAIHRFLAPGGLLALFDNNPLNPGAMWVMKRIPFDRDAQPVRASTLRKLALAAGFSSCQSRTYFYFPGPLRFLRFLEPLLERVPLGAQYALYARS